MSRWYRTGTASIANAATAVTGSGCAWASQVKAGDAVRFDGSDRWYEVASVESNTALTLATPFAGSTVTGVAYEVQRTSPAWSVPADLNIKIASLLATRTSVAHGDGPPAADIGGVGSIYFDELNNRFYPAKGVSGWGAGISFVGGPTGPGYGGSSTDSMAIGSASGTRALTIGNGYAYTAGASRARMAASGGWVEGQVDSYTGGVLTITADRVSGSGTFSAWQVSLVADAPTGVTSVAASDGGIEIAGGGPITGTGTARTRREVDARTGTSETIANADRGQLVTFANASAVAVSVTANEAKWAAPLYNHGPGTVTITPSSGQINGADTALLYAGQMAELAFDGTNYTMSRAGNVASPAAVTAGQVPRFSDTTGRIIGASAATLDAAGGLVLPSILRLTGIIVPAQITGNVNDYAPTGWAAASTISISASVPATISGFSAGADGEIKAIENVGTQPIYVPANSASSVAANRVAARAGVTLLADQMLVMRYSVAAQRWRIIAAPTSGRQMTPFDASAMRIRVATTSPALGAATASAMKSAATNGLNTMESKLFAGNADQAVQMKTRMSSAWDRGTITAVPTYGIDSGTVAGSVVWEVSAVAMGSGDSANAAQGGAQASLHTPGALYTIYDGPETAAITVAGSPQAGDIVNVEVKRRASSNTSDTCTLAAHLLAVAVFWNAVSIWE